MKMSVVFLGAANPETIRMIRAVQAVDPTFSAAGFIDNDVRKAGTQFFGYPVLGGFEVIEELQAQGHRFVNLITGSTRVRYETSREMAARGCQFVNFIHPSVDLAMVELGVGNYVQEAVVLQAAVAIGDNSSIHMGSLIGHESIIGNSVFIAHGCRVSGSVTVGDGTFLGTSSVVLPRLAIGKWATVGAGAVVTRDVPDYATVVGVPARVIRVDDAPTHESGAIFST
jgi:sugar O-acyltransferase (sialic acid O-acetyltransferase NeuD family)